MNHIRDNMNQEHEDNISLQDALKRIAPMTSCLDVTWQDISDPDKCIVLTSLNMILKNQAVILRALDSLGALH